MFHRCPQANIPFKIYYYIMLILVDPIGGAKFHPGCIFIPYLLILCSRIILIYISTSKLKPIRRKFKLKMRNERKHLPPSEGLYIKSIQNRIMYKTVLGMYKQGFDTVYVVSLRIFRTSYASLIRSS